MKISKRVGKWEIIINNGAGSIIFHGLKHEVILNLKPTTDEPQQLLIQFFVFKTPSGGTDDQQTS